MSDITLTQNAAKRVAWIAQRQHKPAILRLAVDGGGCAGFTYKFELAPAAENEDQVSETDGTEPPTHFGYDAAGNQTSMTDGAGAVSRSAYDKAGRVTAMVEPVAGRVAAAAAAHAQLPAPEGAGRHIGQPR